LLLHAHRLVFDHPVTGARVEAVAPIPDEFAEFLTAVDRPAIPYDAAAPPRIRR
jgi:hypothetical protein